MSENQKPAARTHHVLRKALAACAAAGLLTLPTTGEAACTITGAGTQTSLTTGDVITCLGAGNTEVETSSGQSNITINIGDGTTVTTSAGATPVTINSSTNSTLHIFNQVSIQGTQDTISLTLADFNTVTIDAGATVATSNNASSALELLFADSNTITIGGQLGDLTAGTYAILAGGTSTGNDITILSTGVLQTSNQTAIRFNAGGNTVTNSGTISSATDLAINGSSGVDTIINAGTISGDLGGNDLAILFSNGDDILELRAGSVITGNVDAGNDTDTLRFGGATNASFDLASLGNANQYREFEQLQKTGASTWTLTGTTTETYSMSVTAGTLAVNGSMVNVDTTISGGTLGGTGTLGDVTASSGGTIAPGNSVGTLNVDGNVIFNSGSTYAVEVDDAGNSDLLEVTGTVVINGGTVAVTIPTGSFAASQDYTIIHSLGGISGTFSNVTWSGYNPLFFNAYLDYGVANNNYVYLVLEYDSAGLSSVAQTPNQSAVASVMGALGSNAPFLSDIVTLSNSGAQQALDSLSGEIHASLLSVIGKAPSLFQSTLTNRLSAAFDINGRDTLASASFSQPTYSLGGPGAGTRVSQSAYPAGVMPPSPYLWFSGAGSWGDIDSDGNAAAINTRERGLFAGLDAPISTHQRVGIAAGWSRTSADAGARASASEGDAWHTAVTGAQSSGNVRLRGSLAYSHYDIDTTRSVVIGNASKGTASAGYGAARIESQIEAGYVLRVGVAALEPYAGVGASWISIDGFTETGAGAANLTASSASEHSPFTRLGLRSSTVWQWAGMKVTPSLDIAWRHLFEVDTSRALAFATAPQLAWTVLGAPIGANAITLTAGIEAALTSDITAAARYIGDLNGDAQTHAISGNLMMKF